MPLGTLFQESYGLFRRYSSLFMGLAAIQVLPALVLAVALQATGVGPRGLEQFNAIMIEVQERMAENPQSAEALEGMPWGMPTDAFATLLMWSAGIFFLQYFLFRTLAMAASVAAVGDAYQSQQPGWGRALASAMRHLPALLAWAVLYGVLLLGSVFLLLIPCLGLFIWIALFAFLSVRLLLVPQVIVAERAGLFQAMSRSWDMTRGTFWRAFGAVMLFSLVVGLAALVVTGIVNAIFSAMFGATSGITIAAQQGTSTVAALLTTPIAYIGYTLLYYDYQLQASAPPTQPPTYPTYPPYQ